MRGLPKLLVPAILWAASGDDNGPDPPRSRTSPAPKSTDTKKRRAANKAARKARKGKK